MYSFESLKNLFSVVDIVIDYIDAESVAVELCYTVIQYNYTATVDEHPPKAAVSAGSVICLPILPRLSDLFCILNHSTFVTGRSTLCCILQNPLQTALACSATRLKTIASLFAILKHFSNYFYSPELKTNQFAINSFP